MKTSKIILLSYTVLIVLILAGVLVIGLVYQDKATASNLEKHRIEHQQETIKLEEFHHLCLDPGCRLTVRGGEETKIYFSHNASIEKVMPQYEIKNDTLFVLSTKYNNGNWIQLVVSDLRTVNAEKANFRIEKLNQETLVVDATQTGIVMANNSMITDLSLDLDQKSKFNGSQYKGNSISLAINDSQVTIYANKKLDCVSGTAIEKSNIRLPKSLKISLESDRSSKVVIQ